MLSCKICLFRIHLEWILTKAYSISLPAWNVPAERFVWPPTAATTRAQFRSFELNWILKQASVTIICETCFIYGVAFEILNMIFAGYILVRRDMAELNFLGQAPFKSKFLAKPCFCCLFDLSGQKLALRRARKLTEATRSGSSISKKAKGSNPLGQIHSKYDHVHSI